MKARYLKLSELERLRERVSENLASYRSGAFGHLAADVSLTFEGSCEIDEAALATVKLPEADNDHEALNSQICYNAMSSLAPYEARDERLWTFLTHTYLLEYARARWPIPEDDEKAVAHIKKHFFARDARGVERDNAASRLWWMAHLCHRVNGLPMDRCLEILLFRSDVRANIIERPTISQNPQIFSALIKALAKSYDGDRKLFERSAFRQLIIRLNSIGGIRLLDAMSEAQIEATLEEIVANELVLVAA